MSRTYQHWIFCDESGNVAHGSERHVIVSLVLVNRRNLLQRIVTDAKRKGPRQMGRGYVLHAAEEYPEVLQYLLHLMAKQVDVQLGVLVFDKEWWQQRIQTDERVYQDLVAYSVERLITLSGVARERVQVILERRYTKRADQERLMAAVVEQANLTLEQIRSERKNSTDTGAALQVADVVAWSFFQKWERQDSSFAEIIASRLIWEEIVTVDRSGVRPIP